ncbi:MAG: permease [Desulfovibrio sp.]|nr:permease [Desulfovibrio sp.]MBI4960705.1 permease [Desulfovibrio sp.]
MPGVSGSSWRKRNVPTPENIDLFAQLCVAILLEASPFLLLGALASGFFEVFVPRESLERLMPKSPLAGVLAGVFLGMVMPCCECGIVPLIRRLLAKGVPPATAMTFMLAGPVINPVVLASTFVAFQGDHKIVVLRCALVGLVAIVIGYTLRNRRPEDMLLARSGSDHCACGCTGEPDLFGSLSDAVPLAQANTPSLTKRFDHALRHAQADFLDMFKILVFGAIIAAAFKTLAPAGLITLLEKDLLLAVTGMMALAVTLSLCSQADAFVAASFTGFPMAASLAFLSLGPILDFKLVLMWQSAFKKDVVRLLIVVPAAMVFAACLLLGSYGRIGS